MSQHTATRKTLILSVGLVVCLVLLGIYMARSEGLRLDGNRPLSESELVASYAPATYGLPDYIGGYHVLAVFSDKNWPCFRDELGVALANSGSVSLAELNVQLANYGIGETVFFVSPNTSPVEARKNLAQIYSSSKNMVCDNSLGGPSPP